MKIGTIPANINLRVSPMKSVSIIFTKKKSWERKIIYISAKDAFVTRL